MMRYAFPPALGAGILLFISGCGNNNTAGAAAAGSSGGTGACPDNLTDAADSEFCAETKAPTDCKLVDASYHSQVCGVAVRDPGEELARSSSVKDFSGTGAPDLGCFSPAGYRKLGTPGVAKASGLVKLFSHGCDSKDVTIEFHKVNRTGPAGDPDIGDLVGTAVVTPNTCKGVGVATDDDDCGQRYECNYTYDGLPTETELMVITKGGFWASLYTFNIFIANDAVKNGVWDNDLRALAADDYNVIAQAAIGSPVSPGSGAVAGEVHDCGDVRLTGATVNVEVGKRALTYFTNDEEHPLPQTDATSTSVLGLYAAIDVLPGPVSVGALGLVGGKVTTVGYFRARVFPDSVTSVTFRGARPFQVPQ